MGGHPGGEPTTGRNGDRRRSFPRPPLIPYRQALSLTPSADGAFLAEIPADQAQGRAAFGGLLAGLALRAMQDGLPADRALRSLLVDFVAPVPPGPARIAARSLRQGRSLSHAEARVQVDGQDCVVALGAFGADRPSRLSLPGQARPALPAPEALPAFPYLEGITPRFTRHFEYRWTPEVLPFSGADQAIVGGWIRPLLPGPVDPAMVLALLDAWPAPVLCLLRAPAPASTVTWMVDLHSAPPPEGWPEQGWWYFAGETRAAGAGYADISGRIWSPDGALVASSRQLVAEFSA